MEDFERDHSTVRISDEDPSHAFQFLSDTTNKNRIRDYGTDLEKKH